jgi:hypothetical protein
LAEEVNERKQTEDSLKESELRLRYLASQILTAQEKERQRIARDLHDEMGQSLMALKMRLNAFKRRVKHGEEGWEEFDQALDFINVIAEKIRETCRSLLLAQDNLTVFEKTGIGENGEEITIIFARSREIPESMLPQVSDKTDEPIDVFTTEAESPFTSFKPDLKQTGIFIDRFLNKWSYEDLAVKYDTTAEGAKKIYHAALKRLQAVVEALDGGKDSPHNFEPWKKMVEERSGSFPAGMRWFLLNKLFQMRPAEIARMEGVKNPQGVRGMIIRVSDQLRAGEISLFEVDRGEAEAAKDRLEAKRAQRRERYAKNKKKVNAKRRETYAIKKSSKA